MAASGTTRIWQAPGRVNLIGEHTDYNSGLVLPMAIGRSCRVAATSSKDGYLRVRSAQFAASAAWPVGSLASLRPRGEWSDLVAGVAWVLSRRGVSVPSLDLSIDSDLPIGAGLSSSAALAVATTLALGGPRDPLALARLARAAENDFTGVPCGIMDQFASAAARAGEAMLLDCRSLDSKPVQLPGGLAVVVVNSMVRHELGTTEYRTRVKECAAAARVLGVESLRDATLASLNALRGILRKRATHVVTENARVEAFAAASSAGALGEMGRLIRDSHRSLRDDYEVSCPELDFLVDSANRLPGVYGARMMGGGFGGSAVNLVEPRAVDSFKAALESSYRAYSGRTPEFYDCAASAGAGEVVL